MAYELSKLAAKLTDEMGMNVTEEAAKHAANSVLSWFEESATESETKIDDFVAGLIGGAKPLLMGLIDKIDGEAG